MTTFDKREEAFEKKFAVDEDLRFKAMVRRSRLIGLFVAEKLGKSGPDADTYAKEIIATVGKPSLRPNKRHATGSARWSRRVRDFLGTHMTPTREPSQRLP